MPHWLLPKKSGTADPLSTWFRCPGDLPHQQTNLVAASGSQYGSKKRRDIAQINHQFPRRTFFIASNIDNAFAVHVQRKYSGYYSGLWTRRFLVRVPSGCQYSMRLDRLRSAQGLPEPSSLWGSILVVEYPYSSGAGKQLPWNFFDSFNQNQITYSWYYVFVVVEYPYSSGSNVMINLLLFNYKY